MQLPPEYEDLTLRELVLLYAGPLALEVPPELRGWLDVAIQLEELIEQRRRKDATQN